MEHENPMHSDKLKDTPQVKEALEFLTSIISSACQFKASDIHIRADHNIMMRLDGRVRQVKGSPVMSDEMIERLIYPLISKYHLGLFKENNQVDLALTDSEGNRVRLNMFRQLGQLALVMRVIESNIPGTRLAATGREYFPNAPRFGYFLRCHRFW